MATAISTTNAAVCLSPFSPSHSVHRRVSPPYLPFPSTSRSFPRLRISATTVADSPPSPAPPLASQSLLTESTRTVTTILTVSYTVSRFLLHRFVSSDLTSALRALSSTAAVAGPLFFARLKDRPSGYLNTPLTVVAAGMAKWLDIYSGVLMVRVLLSWFPNIPWDRQPLSAIRDLCDPYLNLFRNFVPPVFDSIDISPLAAFAVLGTLGSILNNSRGMY